MIRGLIGFPSVAFYTVVCALGLILFIPLKVSGKKMRKFYFDTADIIINSWLRFIMIVCGAKLKVSGLENVNQDRPCFVVANHSSSMDISSLQLALRRRGRFIAKKELFRVPFLGWGMAAGGNISIDRSSAKKGAESFESAVQSMKRDNIKVIMFPEGTRSRDGHIRPFKSGAFYYPVKSGIPIIPAAVRGAGKVLPKGSLMPRPGEIEVEFMPPIETAGMELSKRKELACLLQEKIKSALGQEEA